MISIFCRQYRKVHTSLQPMNFHVLWNNYFRQYNLSRYMPIFTNPLFQWMNIYDENGQLVGDLDEDDYLTRMSYLHAENQYSDETTHHLHRCDDENTFLTRMSHMHSYCYMKD
jgi:hypothetical protein